MEGVLVFVNLLAVFLTVSGQVHPDIALTTAVSHTGLVMKGENFHFNCTVNALPGDMQVQIYKAAYDVMPTDHIMYTLGSDWPQIIVHNDQLSSDLIGLSRYSVNQVMSTTDNTTTTTVTITGIHTEDGGTWNARVVQNATVVVHASNSTAIHVPVVANITSLRVMARAATGRPAIPELENVILSDGPSFPMNADMKLKLLVLVGIEGFTRPYITVNLTGVDISSTDLTPHFLPMDFTPSNRSDPGGLITFTGDLYYVYDNFTPSVMHHGDMITFNAMQEGYGGLTAYFVLNVQSKPVVTFDAAEIVAPVDTSSVTVTCMVTAHPVVSADNVTWAGPVNLTANSDFTIKTTPPDGKKTTSTLTIRDVKEEYQGDYTCTAVNTLGSTTATISAVEEDTTASSAEACQASAMLGLLLAFVTVLVSLP